MTYQLHCGDYLRVMRQIPSASIDAIITDLPTGQSGCDWDKPNSFWQMWDRINRVVKRNATVVLLGGTQPFTAQLIMSNREHFKYCWYWYKNMTSGFQFAKTQPLRSMEDICVFWSGDNPTYNKQLMKSRIRDRTFQDGAPNGDSRRNKNDQGLGVQPVKGFFADEVAAWNVLEFPCVPRATGTRHVSEKPVPLLEFLIRSHSNPGDTVLDFTAGSFSTGEACLNTNRNFIGTEKDAEFFREGEARMKDRAEEIERMLLKPWEIQPEKIEAAEQQTMDLLLRH